MAGRLQASGYVVLSGRCFCLRSGVDSKRRGLSPWQGTKHGPIYQYTYRQPLHIHLAYYLCILRIMYLYVMLYIHSKNILHICEAYVMYARCVRMRADANAALIAFQSVQVSASSCKSMQITTNCADRSKFGSIPR